MGHWKVIVNNDLQGYFVLCPLSIFKFPGEGSEPVNLFWTEQWTLLRYSIFFQYSWPPLYNTLFFRIMSELVTRHEATIAQQTKLIDFLQQKVNTYSYRDVLQCLHFPQRRLLRRLFVSLEETILQSKLVVHIFWLVVISFLEMRNYYIKMYCNVDIPPTQNVDMQMDKMCS